MIFTVLCTWKTHGSWTYYSIILQIQTEHKSCFFYFSFFFVLHYSLIGRSGSFCFSQRLQECRISPSSLMSPRPYSLFLFVMCCCTTFILCLLRVPWDRQCFIIVFPSTSLLPSEAPLCDPYDKMTFVSSPLSGRLPHLSFVLCSPPSIFPTERNLEKFLKISIHAAFGPPPPTVCEWMSGQRGVFHQSLTSVLPSSTSLSVHTAYLPASSSPHSLLQKVR